MRSAAVALLLAILPAAAQTGSRTAAAAPPKPAAPTRAATPSVKDLKFPPLRPIQIPKVETFTLSNGLKVYLLEDHELPVINGMARARTGNLFDPGDKVGLAGLTGTVMRSGGTRELTGDQIDERLEDIAASVESGIGETSGSVSFSAMKESADRVMAIFRDVLTEPEFRQDRLDLAKTQVRSSIARRNDDAKSIAEREFSDILYGKDTPYGWRMEYATIDRITRADLQRFHQRYFFPLNMRLAVWGDFDSAAMRAKLESLFGAWKAEQPPVPEFPKVKAVPHPGANLAVKRDVAQTFFAVGHLGGEFRDPDYPALAVMADILGGGFRSRLLQRIRTRMGAAYEVSAGWGANYDHPGLFEVSGSTRSMSTVETLRAVREEIERIRTSEVTEAELETARQSALNSLVFAFDTRAKTLGRILTYEYYGYPNDFIDRYQKGLAVVTRADVLRVAKAHLKPEDLMIMAVGNPDEMGSRLESLGMPVEEVDLAIAPPTAAAPKVDQASLAAGAKLLQLVQQAVGGEDRVAAVRDVLIVNDFQVQAAPGGMRVKQTDRWVAPAHFRQDSEMPSGRISAYSDGQTGWIATPQGSGPLGGPQLKQVRGDLFRNYFRLLSAVRLGYQVALLSQDALEVADGAGQVARLRVDPETALPRSLTYEAVHVSGPPMVVEEQYSDFREVSGIKVPFHTVILQGGARFAEVSVQEYKINPGLKPEELSARPR